MAQTINVLDHGSITLLDVFGGDERIVEAARICYRSEPGDQARDQRLLNRCVGNDHSVLEHAVLYWRVKLPIFVARQWMRHRIGSFAEVSLRYCEAVPGFFNPYPQSAPGHHAMESFYASAWATYESLIAEGMKREQARAVLPVAIYTEFVWTVNVRSFIHWYRLRSSYHAQAEHRYYAEAAKTLWAGRMPWTAAAYDWCEDLRHSAGAT